MVTLKTTAKTTTSTTSTKESKVSKVVLVKSSPLIKTATSISPAIVNSTLIKSPTVISKSSSLSTTTLSSTASTSSTTKTTSVTISTNVTTNSPITSTSSSTSVQSRSPSTTTTSHKCPITSNSSNQFCAILDDFVNKFSTDSGQRLTCLNLSFCSLKTIPHQISKFKCLKNLNLSCNELTSIKFPSSNGTIESLALSFNQITINESTLQLIATTFTRLVKLNLSYNSIGDSNDLRLRIDFSAYQFLRELNVSGIYWRNLRGIKGNSVIKRFYLHSSGLMGLPCFTDFDSCVSLDLSNNEINFDRRTVQRIVRYLPSLRYLDISGNLNDSRPDFRWTDKWSRVEMVKTRCSNDNNNPVIMAMSNKFLSDLSALAVVEFNSQLRDNLTGNRKGVLIGLITGDPNAGQLATNLKRIFETELMCPETWGSYMKNTILSCYKFLDEERILRLERVNNKRSDKTPSTTGHSETSSESSVNNGQQNEKGSQKCDSDDYQQMNRNSRKELANINIILCHLVAESSNRVKLRLSHCGSDVKIRLVKVSSSATSTATSSTATPNNKKDDDEDDKENKETSFNQTISSSSSSASQKANLMQSDNQSIPGQEANFTSCTQREADLFEAHSFTITDPICQEIILTNDQEILFLGINFMLNEDRQLNKILKGKGYSLHDKLKRYTELESSARNTDDVISFAIQLSPISNGSSAEPSLSMEFTEKYKSWECIVTQNQNFKFNRRLIAMPLTKNLTEINNTTERNNLTINSKSNA